MIGVTSHRPLSLVRVMLLAGLLVSSACASGGNGPMTVSLVQLSADEGGYDGRDIKSQGIVRQFQDPDGTAYYTIEDGRQNRVELEPATASVAYVGQQVDVIGTFHFDDRRGRSISVERLSR